MFTTRKLIAAAFAVVALTASTASAQNAGAAKVKTQPQPQAQSASSEKPDLIVTDITFDPSGNEVKVKLKNIGDKRADDSHVRLKIVVSVGGQNPQSTVLFDQEKSVGDINQGNDKTKDFDVSFSQIKTKVDQFKAQVEAQIDQLNLPAAVKLNVKRRVLANLKVQAIATADNRNEIAEKNEGNNNRTETFPQN